MDFYSSTWDYFNRASILDSTAEQFFYWHDLTKNTVIALNHIVPNVKFIKNTSINPSNLNISPTLLKHCNTSSNHDLNYYFGRVAHLEKAITIWNNDLIDYDVIIHARWDCIFRNTNFFNDFVDACARGLTFRDLKIDLGNVYGCDWAYGGPADQLIDLYQPNAVQRHIDIFQELFDKNPTSAYTFLIGHNIHSTYAANQLKSIFPSDFDCTLVRKHQLPFRYSDNTWQQINKIFIDSTTPPVDKS